jgi:hypothetical protein
MPRRGGGRRARSSSGGSPLPRLLAATKSIFDVTVSGQRGCIFTSDSYTIDGVTSKVGAFVDLIDDTHTAAQTSSALQVVAPAADSTLNGAKSYTFAGGQRYFSSRAASAFRYLHEGPFFELAVFVSGSSDRILWSTINFAATAGQNGALSFHGPTSISRRGYNAGSLALAAGPATPFTNGARGSFAMHYLEGGSPEYTTRGNGAVLSTGASAGAPAAADPQNTLYIGGHSGGTLYYTGRLAFLGLMPAVPTAAQLSIISQYTLAKYGIAA